MGYWVWQAAFEWICPLYLYPSAFAASEGVSAPEWVLGLEVHEAAPQNGTDLCPVLGGPDLL